MSSYYPIVPFVLGVVPEIRVSRVSAALIDLASALKIASALWWLLAPVNVRTWILKLPSLASVSRK